MTNNNEAVPKLEPEQIEILHHAEQVKFYCGGSKEMDVLVENGYMREAGKKSFVPDMYYQLTGKGKQALAIIYNHRKL